MHVVRLQTTFVIFGCTQHNLNKFRSAFICSKIQVQVFTEHEGTKNSSTLTLTLTITFLNTESHKYYKNRWKTSFL